MQFLRQSTASQVIELGPFIDDTDFKSAKTGLSIANTDIKIRTNAATTFASKNSGGATHIADGYYYTTLDATDTATLGRFDVKCLMSASLTVWHHFMVLPPNIYDSMVLGSDLFDVSMTQILGTAVSSPATAGILDVNLKNISNAAVSASAAQLGVNVIQVNGTSQTARDIGASVLLSSGTGTGQISLSSGTVTVGTNSDKTGYTVSTVSDKTGYSLANGSIVTATFGTCDFTSTMKTSITTAATAATPSVTVSDKTGFALTAAYDAAKTAMASYAQPTGFLAATFPGTVASTTNITAGTITTATNLTNAPTNGDFTAAMKSSLSAATPAVTVSDKTGFILGATGLDSITTTANTTVPTTWPKKMLAVFESIFAKQILDGSTSPKTIKTYAADGTTVTFTQNVSDTGTVQTKGVAS